MEEMLHSYFERIYDDVVNETIEMREKGGYFPEQPIYAFSVYSFNHTEDKEISFHFHVIFLEEDATLLPKILYKQIDPSEIAKYIKLNQNEKTSPFNFKIDSYKQWRPFNEGFRSV